jgi:hypothetical protein
MKNAIKAINEAEINDIIITIANFSKIKGVIIH